ncbi:MAG: hypothetical protein H6598_10215 [Flavobacteriales bacterium]|nr:hypothetical protein [Flavobacteriales bacterium]
MEAKKKIELLEKFYVSCGHGLRAGKANAPRQYLEELGLDYLKVDVGFISGQFHHRQSEAFKSTYEQLGILTKREDIPTHAKGGVPYSCFGNYGLVFPLRNEKGEIVNLFARRFKLATPIEEYLYPLEGAYPKFPEDTTKTLYLCHNILEAASILQGDLLEKNESVMALFDGIISETQLNVISKLEHLQDVVFLSLNPEVSVYKSVKDTFDKLNVVELDMSSKSVHDYLLSNQLDVLQMTIAEKIKESLIESSTAKCQKGLSESNPQKLIFQGRAARYEVIGRLPMDLSQLRVSLRIIGNETGKLFRTKIDLFETADIQHRIKQMPQSFDGNLVEVDLIQLTELLEDYRDKLIDQEVNNTLTATADKVELTPMAQKQAMSFLQKPDLLSRIDKLIEAAGIIGEEASRKTAFVIASSYKMAFPMHGLIQASSGKGKSHLINTIASLMPQEDVINLSRITSRSLYNYQRDELMYKLIVIQDEDGLDEESLYALRELQSAGFIASSTSSKNHFGKHQSRVTRVNGHFATLMASTKNEIYTDNESRSIQIGIDESDEQTERIIEYSNKVRAGLIDKEESQNARHLLRNAIRLLKQKEVINPYAHLIKLPVQAKMLRRLNNQFQDFVAQITLLNQYQREQDEKGRIITHKKDVIDAVNIFFTSIMFKVDELDSSTRQLFELMKAHVLNQPKGRKHEFSRKEIREKLKLKKTKTLELFNHLQEMEYIHVSSGSANKGFQYMISEWDEGLGKLKERIKQDLEDQTQKLGLAS